MKTTKELKTTNNRSRGRVLPYPMDMGILIYYEFCSMTQIGHFQVTLCLIFKTSPHAKPFIINENVSLICMKMELCSSNSFSVSYEWFYMETHFDTEAKGNLKMAYSDFWTEPQIDCLSFLLINLDW